MIDNTQSTGLVSRRALIAGTAGVCAAFLVSGGSVAGFVALRPPEMGAVEALARALFPAWSLPAGTVAREVERLLRDVFPPATTPAFRATVRALEMGTLVFRGQRFSELDDDLAREVIAVWTSPEVRERGLCFDLLRVVMAAAVLRSPQVMDEIGWAPGCR